jgi:hypothetical protein
MPRMLTPETSTEYYLIAFDADGRERTDDPDGSMSQLLLGRIEQTADPVTDVFLLSHGWLGDIPGAKRQYDNWVDTMAKCQADLAEIKKIRPGFRPLLIGLHWPSMPWGDETYQSVSYAAPTTSTDPVTSLVEDFTKRMQATPAAKSALKIIIQSAADNAEPDVLPESTKLAFLQLNHELGLDAGGVGAAPGADREAFDPEAQYQSLRGDAPNFGMLSNAVLDVVRNLSFWKMKNRARTFGEQSAHSLLSRLQQASADRDVRFHVMGHSFGCVVMSGTLAGPVGGPKLPRPVDSALLAQGALSLWSYCSDIPMKKGTAGYFRRIFTNGAVRGPLLTTRSIFDTAVGRFYPIGAGVVQSVDFAPGTLPRYGGIGSFGIQGPGLDLTELELRSADAPYEFSKGKVYNLECSNVVKVGEGSSGAHSDICHPEVGHAFWQAVKCGVS